MNLIDLAQEKGLHPKRTSSHGGGEYHSACPNCNDGKDRFTIWPNETSKNCTGRYWCRQCEIKGDSIQFCHDFLGLNFSEACRKLSVSLPGFHKTSTFLQPIVPPLKLASEPALAWQEKAEMFVEWAHRQLQLNPTAISKLYERGLTENAFKQFTLGYCPKDMWRSYDDWGIKAEAKENSNLPKIWLPQGLVIPWISPEGKVLKINIRRLKWFEGDKYGKYIKTPGSMNCPAVYGDVSSSMGIILESEFDAILIQQEASDLVFCVATGGSCQPMDLSTDFLIRKADCLLFCPDVDQAGARFWSRLQRRYTNGLLWPAPIGKSPGDAFKLGINLREWIKKSYERRSDA
ncbi:MAG: hypothetical protein A3D96_01825 [Chlamydiae bacterium RIFCSPHIGHO2_12_FULL_44_59]|nr:MAG: hypothetical protein A2796_04515 [Chlamydiae bacterium RIFCSPHIGHO2_01_FULL_44_39]OGN57835.1 MAG: hypothetical protein A3C42_04130 [Chlamydiae bacterium RIFCSPHIGHO2_02_FULL_45_9]OGN60649.1 MAG: hypothetical protein A3D96_01825 [Chlamydiae bacterium RIFCSPHIGHO2_12_FULL_44_59]OGN66909.1 MAG: hypothetical protein A2978_02055 [Chlamydiae bacterium RIFCSPLOWO2_01_FULL_44_52]OGN67461.1 MAG: hypothetical protein A3I67_03270 [Chlamydiae bacterium RIFCSPLOWO2_02_FULL_45_22]OGN71162.1 MAG: hyp